jgi:hypothetical protein
MTKIQKTTGNTAHASCYSDSLR